MVTMPVLALIVSATFDGLVLAGLVALLCELHHRQGASSQGGPTAERELGEEPQHQAPRPGGRRSARTSTAPTAPAHARTAAAPPTRRRASRAARLSSHGFEVYTEWPFGPAEARRRQRETARALGRDAEDEVDLGGGTRLAVVLIPAGQFLMGSSESEEGRSPLEASRHVTLMKPFWMGKYEITQEQWQAVTGRNPSCYQGPRDPVESVSWNDVQRFLRELSVRVWGGGMALPTEEQWEYACRAGTATPFHFGAAISVSQAHSVWAFPSCNGRRGRSGPWTRPVGSFPANAWGLHDMHGNVWEWCASLCTGGSDDASPEATVLGLFRALRGGPLPGTPCAARSAHRCGADPADAGALFGFRVVREVE